jgi:hypothetical protein
LALLGRNTLHYVGVAIRVQKRMTTTANRFSTFVASTGLHCTSAFADAEDVTVRAGIPMPTVSWDRVVSFTQSSE